MERQMADIVQTVFSSSDSRPEKFNSIEEVLEFYYRDLFGNNGYIAPFTGVSDKVERKLNNSIKSVANSQVEPEHVLLFYDATLFGAADNGFLFTGDAVFYCQFGGYSVKFPYSEIKKIEYVKNTVTGDSGKEKIQETTTVYYDSRKFVIEQSYISDPEKFIEMFDYLKQVTIRNYARKDSGICGSCSEEKSKIDFFDDLPSEIQITYLKIIINFCLAGNEKNNQKIFSSLFRLTAKLKLGAAEREAVFKYMDSLQDTFTLSQSIFEKIDAEKRAVLKYSILKDLVFMHLALKGRDPGSNVFIRDFINHYQLQSGAVELFVMMHDCGKNIADVTGDDSAVENNLRMIAQKASECDVPPASLFFTGGAVLDIDAAAAGLAAFGLSGLSGACRRQDPFCSVAREPFLLCPYFLPDNLLPVFYLLPQHLSTFQGVRDLRSESSRAEKREHLFPVSEGCTRTYSRGADCTAGIGKTQCLFHVTPPKEFRGKSRNEVVAGACGVYSPDAAGGQPDHPIPVFEEAALASELDDDIPDTIIQKHIRHLFRIVLSGVIFCFILIRRDVVNQRQCIPDFPQVQRMKVRQLSIGDHQGSLFLHRTEDAENYIRFIKRSTEKRAQNYRIRLQNAIRIALRVEIVPVGAVGNGLPGSVVVHEHSRNRCRMLPAADDQPGVYTASAQQVGHHLACGILTKCTEDRCSHAQL